MAHKLAAITVRHDASTNFYEIYGLDGTGEVRHIGEFYPYGQILRNDDRLTQEYPQRWLAEQRAKEIAQTAHIQYVASQSAAEEATWARLVSCFRREADGYIRRGQKLPDPDRIFRAMRGVA